FVGGDERFFASFAFVTNFQSHLSVLSLRVDFRPHILSLLSQQQGCRLATPLSFRPRVKRFSRLRPTWLAGRGSFRIIVTFISSGGCPIAALSKWRRCVPGFQSHGLRNL